MTHTSLPAGSIVIRGAQVLLPSGDIERREVAIASGKIIAVETQLDVSANTETIDGTGLTLLPGVIDPQVTFCVAEQPYEEALLTSTGACAKGGITSFLEMPNPSPPATASVTTKDVLTNKLAIAARHSLINYGFFVSASPETPGGLQTVESACGIELVISPADSLAITDAIQKVEPVFAKGDRLIAFRARAAPHKTEHHTPHNTQLALRLSKKYQRRLHILNLSTAEEANLLRHDKPSWVTTAVTPQHLLLDIKAFTEDEDLSQRDSKREGQRAPSITHPHAREILWQALLDGVIDFITTNHVAPALAKQTKDSPHNPLEIPGVETSLPLMLTQTKAGRCSVAQVSHWLSTAVARAYGIPNKGLIEPGYDADLVLVDLVTYRPVLREELITANGWSPFEGWPLTGWPMITIVGGQVVYNYGKLNTDSRGQALRFNAEVQR